MTEPTNAEIVALADATRTAEGGANGYILPISFCRAVLAKWGTPPAVAERLEVTEAECEAAVLELEIEDLHTTPQPTRARAVAVPLTDEQIRAMCKESWVFETVKQWVRITEQHHGIKGGQHGADTRPN